MTTCQSRSHDGNLTRCAFQHENHLCQCHWSESGELFPFSLLVGVWGYYDISLTRTPEGVSCGFADDGSGLLEWVD